MKKRSGQGKAAKRGGVIEHDAFDDRGPGYELAPAANVVARPAAEAYQLVPHGVLPVGRNFDAMRPEQRVLNDISDLRTLALFSKMYLRTTQGLSTPVIFDPATQHLITKRAKFDF